MCSPFADNQECLILYGIGQVYSSELKAAKPSRHFFALKGVEHFAELIHGILFVGITLQPTESV